MKYLVEKRPLRRDTVRKKSAKGYTLVEVMTALGVLSVGITGAIAVQNASVFANQQAQEMTLAVNIGRLWMERLRSDALQWNRPSRTNTASDLATDTAFLCAVVGCSGGTAAPDQWIVPTSARGGSESAAFDHVGNEVTLGSARTRYCTNIRVAWLRPDTVARQGILRAEVRVWWYRDGVDHPTSYASCGNTASLQTLGTDTTRLRIVNMSTVIGGNPQ